MHCGPRRSRKPAPAAASCVTRRLLSQDRDLLTRRRRGPRSNYHLAEGRAVYNHCFVGAKPRVESVITPRIRDPSNASRALLPFFPFARR